MASDDMKICVKLPHKEIHESIFNDPTIRNGPVGFSFPIFVAFIYIKKKHRPFSLNIGFWLLNSN